MGLKVSDLKPSPYPIYDFTGDSVIPLGVISFPMTLGEYPRQSCVMVDFLVIDQPSAFNTVFERPLPEGVEGHYQHLPSINEVPHALRGG